MKKNSKVFKRVKNSKYVFVSIILLQCEQRFIGWPRARPFTIIINFIQLYRFVNKGWSSSVAKGNWYAMRMKSVKNYEGQMSGLIWALAVLWWLLTNPTGLLSPKLPLALSTKQMNRKTSRNIFIENNFFDYSITGFRFYIILFCRLPFTTIAKRIFMIFLFCKITEPNSTVPKVGSFTGRFLGCN